MNNKVIISICLLVGLVALATFVNFNETAVEAAYQGNVLPSGLDSQTLYYNGEWQASSALENDGENINAGGIISALSFINLSDLALKENVLEIENALLSLKSLKAITFSCNESDERDLGIVVSDSEKVMPELVIGQDNDKELIKYNGVVALLVEAIKEQQVQIDELKTELRKIR